jgi:hypothetical protein
MKNKQKRIDEETSLDIKKVKMEKESKSSLYKELNEVSFQTSLLRLNSFYRIDEKINEIEK